MNIVIIIMLSARLAAVAVVFIYQLKAHEEAKKQLATELSRQRVFFVKLVERLTFKDVVPPPEANNEELAYNRELEAEVERRNKTMRG